MKINLRTKGIVALSFSMIMLFEQCCNCGEKSSTIPEEKITEDDEESTSDEDIAETDSTLSELPADKGAASTPASETAKKQKPLSITITNLKSATAPVIFSVYDNEETYLDPKAQLKTYRFVPKGKTLKLKITDIKFGTYAIAFYQDMNDSGDIDKNGLGIPKEPYAFSNDIRPKMSAPSFADCKFVYSKTANRINVKMGN